MAKGRGRAWRRAQADRVTKRAERIICFAWYVCAKKNDANVREAARKNADHLKKCSCWMCRNLRRNEGPTRQERQANNIDDYLRHT